MVNSPIHPVQVIEDFLASHPEICKVELSLYKYQPETVHDERTMYRAEPARLHDTFVQLRSGLSSHEEIAFHSKVYIGSGWNEQVMHIPLVDFSGALSDYALEMIAQVIQELECEQAFLVSSGRSFHMYALRLLTPDAWVKFMGRILLLNLRNKPEIVDCRWVGHRLVAGYGSLRWTKNTKQYLTEPSVLYQLHAGSFQPIIEAGIPEPFPL